MTLTMSTTDTLVATSCATCGVVFAVPANFMQARKGDGKDFWCPNGHVLHFGNNTLKQQLEREKQRVRDAYAYAASIADQHQAERKAHASTKGQLTKTRKRIAHGVCPCCKRSFSDVRRHMKGQHPDFVAAAE